MPDYQKELVEYRLQTAQEKLHSAKILLDERVGLSLLGLYFGKNFVH